LTTLNKNAAVNHRTAVQSPHITLRARKEINVWSETFCQLLLKLGTSIPEKIQCHKKKIAKLSKILSKYINQFWILNNPSKIIGRVQYHVSKIKLHIINVITISDYREKRDYFIHYNVFNLIHAKPTKKHTEKMIAKVLKRDVGKQSIERHGSLFKINFRHNSKT
jgi:hypothetical protein